MEIGIADIAFMTGLLYKWCLPIISSSYAFLQFELPSLPQSGKAVKGCLFC